MAVALTLVCHGATAAVRAAAFPGGDEGLDAAGLAAAGRLAGRWRRVDAAWTAPARRTEETAAAMELPARPEPALRDLDCGAWAGRTLDDVAAADAAGVAAWLGDPAAAPHGGETLGALLARVAAWLARPHAGRVVAVTHPAVARAAVVLALGAPPAAFWRVDVAPLGRVRLRGNAGRWTLTGLEREGRE